MNTPRSPSFLMISAPGTLVNEMPIPQLDIPTICASEDPQCFTNIINELGENYPAKRNAQVVNEAIIKFDANRNGVIEFEEFLEVMHFMIDEKGYELK